MSERVGIGEIESAVDTLRRLMHESGGWSFDTYDTRIGGLYAWLYRNRANRVASATLLVLYAFEFAAPLLYRRLRGIAKSWDPMGNSYRAGAELTLSCISNRTEHLDSARVILDEVVMRAVGEPGKRGFALGFPCITGSERVWKTSVPVAHYTLRVARKLIIWERLVGDGRYRAPIVEAIAFLLDGLPWIERADCTGVGYTPEDPLHVINIWADVASILAAYDQLYGDSRARTRALTLTNGVLAHQNADGSWPYFAHWEGKPGREDNSHTAMVLGALADVALCYAEPRPAIARALRLGIPRWIEMFFDEQSGRFWNLVKRPTVIFTVCLGDALYAINRLLRLPGEMTGDTQERLRRLEGKMIAWAMANLRLRDGRFCERHLPLKHFRLKSIRSFDGLICDALALVVARERLGDSTRLWAQ